MDNSRKYFVALALSVVLTASATWVWAHDANPADWVHACVNGGSGIIRMVEATEECRIGEVSLDWNPNATAGGSALSMLPFRVNAFPGGFSCISFFDRVRAWPCEESIRFPVASDGAVVSLLVSPYANTADGPVVVSVVVNGVVSSLSVTIPPGATGTHQATGSLPLLMGDKVEMQLDTSAMTSGRVDFNGSTGFALTP